ncbi:MAG: hypothetical protein ACK56I_02860, partial [bacterium]
MDLSHANLLSEEGRVVDGPIALVCEHLRLPDPVCDRSLVVEFCDYLDGSQGALWHHAALQAVAGRARTAHDAQGCIHRALGQLMVVAPGTVHG